MEKSGQHFEHMIENLKSKYQKKIQLLCSINFLFFLFYIKK